MKKIVLTLATFFSTALLLGAQQTGWLARLRDRMTGPNPVFDTAYVYPLRQVWVASMAGDLILTGLETRSDVTRQGDGSTTHLAGHLRNRWSGKVGGGLTYGPLQLVYTTEAGAPRGQRNKYSRIALVKPRFGVSFQYYTIHGHLDGTATGADAGATSFSSQYPGEMRNVVADAFYFFQPEHFAYSAVMGRHLIQRRSGGSWMLRAAYSQGELRYDLRDVLVRESHDHVGRYRTGDFSLGAGYSYNWVPLHRAPHGRDTRGLRNLTLNLTAVPGVSIYNHLHSTAYVFSDPDHPVEGKTRRNHTFGLPGITLAARAGLSFSWDRFILCSTITYNRSSFRGIDSVNLDGQTRQRYETKTAGTFYDITARMQLNVRF